MNDLKELIKSVSTKSLLVTDLLVQIDIAISTKTDGSLESAKKVYYTITELADRLECMDIEVYKEVRAYFSSMAIVRHKNKKDVKYIINDYDGTLD